jgi:hypothetical protein
MPDHVAVTILQARNGSRPCALTKREESRSNLENFRGENMMGPLLRRPLLNRVALLFGLAGLCLGAAIVLGADRIASRTGDLSAAAERNSGDVTGTIGWATARRLALTDEERGHIFDGIMKLHDAPVADVPAPEAATALPRSVALQELPVSVTRQIPMVQGYKFVKLDDRILLVSPVDRSVVAEMPRYRTMLD